MKQTTLPLQITKKINIILCSLSIIFFVIIGRLFYLQIYLNHYHTSLSQKNFTRILSTDSPRGNIIDSNGLLLATNRPLTNLYWKGTGNGHFSKKQKELLNQLETILQESLNDDKKKSIFKAEYLGKKVLIASDINFEQLSKISEQYAAQPNIEISTHFKRFYPYNTTACHILGYLSQASFETIGKMGLEQLFEEELRGEKGSLKSIINSLGKCIEQQEVKQAITGKTIRTTLDLALQILAEEVFPENYAGSLIIMNPETGAIKALLSRPNFDPNIFLCSMSTQEWQELQEKKPFLNRAFNACYPPASIFKLVTIPAALELGIVTQHTKTYCHGFTRFGGRDYHCKRHEGHGLLTIKESLAFSCNILFFEIGKRISINTLADYAKRFGLGQKTGLIFNEKEGVIPTSLWKFQHKGEPWWPGETLSAVIGQSFLLVTPIQIACMISSIFEGYLVKPRIIESETVEKKEIALEPETLRFLQRLMKKAVKCGTGQRVSKIQDIEVYAKTGTAQTSALGKENLGKEFLEHGWFASYFRYKDKQPLTMIIMVEHAGSASVAINTASNFLKRYRHHVIAQESLACQPFNNY